MSSRLPVGWHFEPIHRVARVVSGGTPSRYVPEFWKGGTVPWVTPTDITGTTGRYLSETREQITERGLRSCSTTLLPPGSLLMTSRATLGEIRIATREVCTNQGFKSLVPNDGTDGDFLYYQMLRSKERYKSFGIGSTFLEVNKKDTERFELLVAPSEEQPRIAKILSTIDEAIEQTEALIAKTQAIKAGLMHDLFTRGVTPDGKLRPPREEAPKLYKESPLGWIPKEWDAITLGEMSNLVTSGSRGWAAYYSDEGAIFLRIGNLTREHPNLRLIDIVNVQPPKSSEGQRTRLVEDDLLISITADLGIAGVVPADLGEAYVNQHIALVRLKPELAASRWLGHWFGGLKAQTLISRLGDSGAKAGLNLLTIRSFSAALPPLDEREIAVSRWDVADEAIRSARISVQKLESYKYGLMHDLLTGRVRVPADERDKVMA